MTKTFYMKRQVQFAETDLACVLHFANYYRMMEEIEHAFWRSVGRSVIIKDGDGHISWPRVATQCEYLAPARFEDELDIARTVIRVSEKSVTYDIGFSCEGRALAAGTSKAVCCRMDASGFTSIPIPADLRAILEEHLEVDKKT